jgi:hypothetical protein
MPNPLEGAVAPNSIEAEAIAELQKEGHVIGEHQPIPNDGEIKDQPAPSKNDEPKKEEPPKDEPKDQPKDEPKGSEPVKRTPTMVEAWKLKVAEDQKASLEKDLNDLKTKVEELSKQKAPVTDAQKEELADDIKKIAEETGMDETSITRIADVISKKFEAKLPSKDVESTVKKLQEERELEKQLNEYSNEFEKDVLPLLEEYQLSGDALSNLKNTLKDYAFSEIYAKVPLKEIFVIKQSEFNLSQPKKSSEGKGIKTRATDSVIDIDNISEDDFAKLPAEKIEEFMQKKSSGSWKRS